MVFWIPFYHIGTHLSPNLPIYIHPFRFRKIARSYSYPPAQYIKMCMPSSSPSIRFGWGIFFFFHYYTSIHIYYTIIHYYYCTIYVHRFMCMYCIQYNNTRRTAACLKAWIRAGRHFTLRAYSNDDWGTRPLTIKLLARHGRPPKTRRLPQVVSYYSV